MIHIHYNFTTKPPCCKPDCGEEHKSERKKIAFKMRNHLWETWKFNKTNNKISLYHWQHNYCDLYKYFFTLCPFIKYFTLKTTTKTYIYIHKVQKTLRITHVLTFFLGCFSFLRFGSSPFVPFIFSSSELLQIFRAACLVCLFGGCRLIPASAVQSEYSLDESLWIIKKL